MKKTVVFAMLLSALCFCGCEFLEKIDPIGRIKYSDRATSSVNNLKLIGFALEMYTQGSKGQLRPHGVTANGDLSKDPGLVFEILRVQGHLIDTYVYAAPYGKTEFAKPNASLEGKNCGYVYIYVEPKYAAASAVAFEKPWHLPSYADRLTVLYGDGHVKTHKIEGVSKMSCRELLLKYPDIFGLHYNRGDALPTDCFDAERNELD